METEIKLSVPSDEVFEALHCLSAELRELRMETVYFDTPEGSISKKRRMLRRRLENGRSVITCKAPGNAPHTRCEWELEGEDPLAALPALVALGAPEELRDCEALVPICGAHYTRCVALLPLAGCTAELALDRGEVFAGEKTAPIRELELELKEGDPEAMLALARKLCGTYGLTEEPRSKFSRALALCEPE